MAKSTEQAATPATEQAATAAVQLLPIEQLRAKHKTDASVFAGVCSANDWRPGRAVAEKDYLAAVQKFINAPITGAGK